MLSPGEIVIPRSKAHDPELAKEFIDHLMKEDYAQGGKVKEPKSYGSVLAAQQKLEKRLMELEKRLGGHHGR
jgi:spermidine/putrescine-binding protein